MLRVAFLIETAAARWGGATTAFLSILDAVATRQGAIAPTSYFTVPPDDDPIWERIRRNPAQFVVARSHGRVLTGDLGRAVAADLRAGKIDVLHIQGLWCSDLVHAARAAQRLGIPVLWQSHGMLFHWAMRHKRLKKQAFLKLGLGRALERTTGFIAPTLDELHNSDFPASCPADRRFLVRLPVSLPDALPTPAQHEGLRAAGRTRYGLPRDAAVFAFLGRLHPIKRLEVTIEAFARAIGPDAGGPPLTRAARLLLLGKGEPAYESRLRERAAALGVLDKVIFAGWVDEGARNQGLAATDALMLNSTAESFGYVVFEAFAALTPAIVTDNLSLAAEFEASGAAIRCRPDAPAIAAAMLRMAALSDAQRAEMARKGFAWAKEEFSASAIGRRFEETYRQVLPQPATNPNRSGEATNSATPRL